MVEVKVTLKRTNDTYRATVTPIVRRRETLADAINAIQPVLDGAVRKFPQLSRAVESARVQLDQVANHDVGYAITNAYSIVSSLDAVSIDAVKGIRQ